MSINDKTFDHRPIEELMAIVKNDFRKFDAENLIDEGNLIKTVMYCNDKLGIPIREVREVAIPVEDFKGELPKDFEKIYYVCGLQCSNTAVRIDKNPFDNNVDQDVIYNAHLNRDQLGCVENYQVVVERKSKEIVYRYGEWTTLEISPSSHKHCHIDSPNKRKHGKYQVEINDDHIKTPFRSGILYIMYIGMMKDENGNITFPFHPMITPYYEWTIKEKILMDMIFNSDGNVGDMLKLAQQERLKAWLDAFNFTTEKGYGEFVQYQKKKELGWYNRWFKYLQ